MEQNFRFSATKHPHQLYISKLQFWKLLRLFSEMHLQTQIGMMSFGKQNVESEQGRGKGTMSSAVSSGHTTIVTHSLLICLDSNTNCY